MVCPRCGAAFEGNFCPQCGAPATPPGAPVATPSAPPMACPRCGAIYQGHFCPRCGLAAGTVPVAVPPPRAGSDFRSFLTILWTLALVSFLFFVATSYAGLLASPAYIVPGVQGIAPGASTNENLTVGDAGWSFQSLNASGATGTYVPSGGDPGGYIQMTIPAGSQAGGEWVQSVDLRGSAPFLAEVRLAFESQAAGQLVIAVESSPAGLNYSAAAAVLNVSASPAWTTIPAVDVSSSIGEPGTYYLKVAFLVKGTAAVTLVGFDNLAMRWTTDAFYYFYLPLPLPALLYISQEPTPFLAYFAFIFVTIVAAGLWYTLRERKPFLRAVTAPLDDIGARLRSPSAWVAIAQVWLATTFFQFALIILLTVIGAPPSSPFTQTSTNAWTLLFDYSAASVFEEIAFRMFLVGLPMAAGAFLWRISRPRGPSPPGAPGAGRLDILGALRYLVGGQVRRDSSREAKLVAVLLIFFSGALFGWAHAPGWGSWKVLPAFVVGLGMGYVFVRHGIFASILVHFATDGSLALSLEGIGGTGLSLFLDLFYIGLAIAGSGFFVWYVLYTWEELSDLWRSFQVRVVRRPAAAAGYPPMPPPPTPGPYAPGSAPPSPPPGYGSPPPQAWTPPPEAVAPPVRGPAQLPQGYAPTYHPPPYGYPPVRFQCPYCGWVEARYENRVFTCLRCGRTAGP